MPLRVLFTARLALGAAAVLFSPAAEAGQPARRKPPDPAVARHIDRDWFRKSLVEDNLSHWLASAATPNGFFRTSLDRQWRPAEKQVGTLVSQTRQLFVMATGWEMTGNPAYREAARRGADFMLAHLRDGEHGGWFYSFRPDGTIVDDSKNSYGHSFVIFGLSHAYRATGDSRYRNAALETWEGMKRRLRDAHGFIKPQTSRDFSQTRGTNTQNPMMHLFEALLALHGVTGSRAVYNDALSLADAIYARLFQEKVGYLPELFDENWRPLPPERKGYLEIGHQFEWAFLLSHAVEKGFPRRYLAIGNRLLDSGLKVGYDPAEGGIFSRGDYQGGFTRAPKGWWEQCESLRAMMHYAAVRGRSDLWEPFDKSLAMVKEHFIDPEYGGWYASYDPERPTEGARAYKGSQWSVGYHVAGMYVEGLRLLGAIPGRQR